MIERMKFVTVTGPKAEYDRAFDDYISPREIQLENALTQLKNVPDLKPFTGTNPYRQTMAEGRELLAALPETEGLPPVEMTADEAVNLIQSLQSAVRAARHRAREFEDEIAQLKDKRRIIEPFQGLDFSIHKLLHFNTVKVRFGRIEAAAIDRFEAYMQDNLDSFFYRCHSDRHYVYGVCFLPAAKEAQMDAVYSSLHFERINVRDDYSGTPSQAIANLDDQMRELTKQAEAASYEVTCDVQAHAAELASAVKKLQGYSDNYDVRRLAALTSGEQEFFLLCGWMTAAEAQILADDLADDKTLSCTVQDAGAALQAPPTKLKNPKILAPFTMFTELYGVPGYNEYDPTLFLALTYPFLFGWMFGDLGQGAVLAIGGFLLYKFKKMRLAGIIGFAGLCSMFFGVMFGSVFGFEDVLPAVWMRPISQMSQVPMIGRLNTVFLYAVGFGMFLIIVTMILNIASALKRGEKGALLVGTNGVAGLIFYLFIVFAIAMIMTGRTVPGGILLLLFVGVPLLCIAFQEPLAAKIEQHKSSTRTGVGMMITQAFFELFEVLLSFFSNTLSFLRVGAYAVSHAAMMEVVLQLAGAEAGSPSIPVIVIGNLFVCLMEGLIVGIQVLRLEYYELFSRFYRGGGRPFTPYRFDDNH